MPKTTPAAVPGPPAALAGVATPPRPGAHPALLIEEVEPGRLLLLRGRLDVAVAADARLVLGRATAAAAGDLVLDLSDLDSVDATGLGVLVGAHRAAGRAGRRLVLRDVCAQVERLLLITRLHRVIRVERSPELDPPGRPASSCA